MRIENRIKALEDENNDPNKKAALNGEAWAMTDEQQKKHFARMRAKLFAIDISKLPEAEAREIQELRDRILALDAKRELMAQQSTQSTETRKRTTETKKRTTKGKKR